MATCDDAHFDTCNAEEQGDWTLGDWQPTLTDFDARRQCIAYNKYVKPWRQKKQLNYCKLNLNDARTFLVDALNKNARPTTCQFNHWYCAGDMSFCANATRISGNITAVHQDKWYAEMLMLPKGRCSMFLRKELLTAGDPDIAGPGVMISYSIEAGLVLIYLLAHYILPLPTSSTQGRLRHFLMGLFSRIHTATSCSIHTLYATATILSYAIVTAAISIYGIYQLPTSLVDIYMNELLVLAPTFSIFPVLALHTLLPDWKGKSMTPDQIRTGWEGRNGFRRALAVVLYLYCLVQVWLVFVKGIRTTDPDFELGGDLDINLSHDVYLYAPKYVKVLVILMLVVPLVGIGALSGMRWLMRRAAKPCPTRLNQQRQTPSTPAVEQQTNYLRTKNRVNRVIRLISVAMMLIQFTWLWYLRTEAMNDAGGIDRDTSWNFGQILAVATWLPVLMEFVYFFLFSNHLSNSNVATAIPLNPVVP